jgi:hypothetical protein
MTDTTDADTHPTDNPDSTCVKPTLTAVSLGSAVQLQLRLDSDDDDHDGDDEQDYNRDHDDSERSLTHSRSHSPVPHATTPPAQQQPTPTPTPNPFAAHVHFHSRVRITSGLRRSHAHGNRTLADSSDSDSPSSSISAPLHYHSRSTVPHVPLGERVSRLAAQALQKRRIAATTAAMASSTAASRRFRARDHEYTPFLRAGVPVTYGAARHGDSRPDDTDSEEENRFYPDHLHSEDAIVFGRWPWRALNRQVSSACNFFCSEAISSS